jgi:arylsulfatase
LIKVGYLIIMFNSSVYIKIINEYERILIMSRPNILHIFVDQQRFDTIGALNNPVIKTPNLDRLAKSGVAFTNAYAASPVCIASRCATIYGQYPANNGCYENTVMPEDGRSSFMDGLTKAGYRTHGIGKCHFSPDPFAMRGFQTREVQEEGGAKSIESIEKHTYLKYLYDKGYRHLMEPYGVRGEMYYIPQPSQLPPEDHPTQWVGDRSLDFIRNNRSSSEPWYLFSSYIHPHPPFSPPNPWHKLYRASLMPLPNIPDEYEKLHTFVNRCQNRYKYRDNGYDKNLIRVMKAYYYACISFVDYQIGRMLDELENTKQLDNTMIIFNADHGEHLGDYRCFGKRSMHDSAARVPLIVKMPGKFDGGKVFEKAVSLIDIAPTVLSVADANITTHKLDGMDLFKLVNGKSEREYVYSQLSFDGMGIGFIQKDKEFLDSMSDETTRRAVFSTYMAASRDWKYFYSAADNREFLFDKKMDPNETRNVVNNNFLNNALVDIKSSLIEHLKENGETGGIKNGEWVSFKVPHFVKDPDAGLLIQDMYTPWSNGDIPGYKEK